ncbi:ABC transporter ATP-binding protein [Limobrevibacterium gyesilva]|uniref:ABC transporter ATP-binding protein n=1 Tax=Limobrevibacterium gyesilva TaxID=2991712 RepID=A0AA41YJ70_9PROT|nr:ABC transporter ATP-binding protein [Limobrevibacterium gyesilva]
MLDGVDLELAEGCIVAVLGASGCGKTTLLRLVAGFDRVDDGEIAIGGDLVASAGLHVPPERRRIGYVPQEGALFPHLTVAENVAFGLDRSERRSGRVEEVLRLTGMQGLDRRYPNELSGGQQQRAALARALAPRPALVLLDEPFNALDLELRRTVCEDVIAAIRVAGATAVLVTHDPQEAFASADRLAIMRAGLVAQCDHPAMVYHAPVDPAVARLTGAAVFLDATLSDGGAETALGRVRLHPGCPMPAGPAVVLLRPEQVALAPPGQGVAGGVVARAFRGDHTLVTVALEGMQLQLRLADAPPLGAVVHLRVTGACAAFPPNAMPAGAAQSISSAGRDVPVAVPAAARDPLPAYPAVHQRA